MLRIPRHKLVITSRIRIMFYGSPLFNTRFVTIANKSNAGYNPNYYKIKKLKGRVLEQSIASPYFLKQFHIFSCIITTGSLYVAQSWSQISSLFQTLVWMNSVVSWNGNEIADCAISRDDLRHGGRVLAVTLNCFTFM